MKKFLISGIGVAFALAFAGPSFAGKHAPNPTVSAEDYNSARSNVSNEANLEPVGGPAVGDIPTAKNYSSSRSNKTRTNSAVQPPPDGGPASVAIKEEGVNSPASVVRPRIVVRPGPKRVPGKAGKKARDAAAKAAQEAATEAAREAVNAARKGAVRR